MRSFNACVASGVAPGDYAAGYDTVWIDLTKGLGGFAGAVLAGSAEDIDKAWRLKQRWGGALRQSGHIAATGLHALDHHVDRLAEDHALAASIGARIAPMPKVARVLPVETNIVMALGWSYALAGSRTLLVDCDLGAIGRVRRDWPFLRDRRIDAYAEIGRRYLDE